MGLSHYIQHFDFASMEARGSAAEASWKPRGSYGEVIVAFTESTMEARASSGSS